MLSFGELNGIARTVAAQSGAPHLFEDIVQEAWVRFSRWPPHHRQGAWLMALQAKNEVIYREKDVSAGMLYPAESARMGALERIWDGRRDKRWWWLVRYALSAHHSGKDRVRAHRYRAELRAVR